MILVQILAFSLFNAKLFQNKVYSFEPSVFNVKQLCKNISLNLLSDQIIFSNTLTSKTKFQNLKQTILLEAH